MRKSFVSKYPELKTEKFITITNGFDPADFNSSPEADNADIVSTEKKIMNIVYTGSLNDWRNLDNFTKALRILIDKNLINKKKIRIKLFGHITYKDSRIISERDLSDIFELFGMREHLQSIVLMKEAHLLLLIIGELEGAEVMTGKIYEYIGAKRNIFGIVIKDGEAERIIKKYNLGYTADTSSQENIADVFLKAYNDFFSGKFKYSPDQSAYKIFSRYELTKKLADIIKSVN